MTSNPLPSRPLLPLWAVWGLAALLCGCGKSAELSLPPEDDAFVSYYQAASAFASGLTRLESTADFERQRPGIDPLVNQLRTYREQMLALPAADRERLAQEHKDLVQQTQDACQALEQFHTRNPEIIGDRWETYWESLQIEDASAP